MSLKLAISSPSSPPNGRVIRCLKSPEAMFLTPINNSLIGLVMVRALNTAPKITITQIDTNTAIVTSRVKPDEATTVGLGLVPTANTPKY